MLSGLFIMLLDNENINGMDILWFSIAIIAMYVRAEGCDNGWREFDGMCYFFSSERVSSPDIAQSNCLGINGVLAAANTMEVNNYLHQTILNTGHHWIGLVWMSSSHNKTIWHWLDGSAVDTNILWAWNEPTGNSVCGKIGVTTQKKLGDDTCTKPLRFICESDEYVSGWLENGGHWYRFHNQSKNFISAMRACADENAYLANIGNTDEFEYITDNIGTTNGNDVQQHWVGLTTLHWLDGSPITWLNNETLVTGNNACVYLHSDENKWESNCNPDIGSVPNYICQKVKSTSATAIPDTITIPSTKPPTNPPPTQTTHVDESKSKTVDDHQTTTVNLSDGNNGRQEMIIMGNSDMPLIAGAVAAIVVVLVVIVVVVTLFLRRRKRSKNSGYHSEENHNISSANNDIQEVDDIQPYGYSEMQPCGISNVTTTENDKLNHKHVSEDISPYYNATNFTDAKGVFALPSNMQVFSDHEPHSGKTESDANINGMPVYAVVDVAKKKAANVKGMYRYTEHQRGKSDKSSNISASETNIDDKLPNNTQKQIKDKQNQQVKQNINLINASNNTPVYAVVDKTKKVQSSKPIPPAKPTTKLTQNIGVDGTSAHIYNDCENVDDIGGGPPQIQYAELDIQEEPSESNKLSYDAGYEYAEVQFKD